jgi:hypothetical protein
MPTAQDESLAALAKSLEAACASADKAAKVAEAVKARIQEEIRLVEGSLRAAGLLADRLINKGESVQPLVFGRGKEPVVVCRDSRAGHPAGEVVLSVSRARVAYDSKNSALFVVLTALDGNDPRTRAVVGSELGDFAIQNPDLVQWLRGAMRSIRQTFQAHQRGLD